MAVLAGGAAAPRVFLASERSAKPDVVSAAEFAGSGSGGRGSALQRAAGKLTIAQRLRAQTRLSARIASSKRFYHPGDVAPDLLVRVKGEHIGVRVWKVDGISQDLSTTVVS